MDKLNDAMFEAESRAQEQEQALVNQQQEASSVEQNLRRELAKSKESQAALQSINDELKAKLDQEVAQMNLKRDTDMVEQSERIAELEAVCKEVEEENEVLKQKFEKEQAIAQQKMEFLQVQLD